MNRERMANEFAFQASAHSHPLYAARAFCKEVGIPPRALAHTAREVVRVTREAHENGASTLDELGRAAADYIADLVGES